MGKKINRTIGMGALIVGSIFAYAEINADHVDVTKYIRCFNVGANSYSEYYKDGDTILIRFNRGALSLSQMTEFLNGVGITYKLKGPYHTDERIIEVPKGQGKTLVDRFKSKSVCLDNIVTDVKMIKGFKETYDRSHGLILEIEE
ncbi:hypothetical protein HYX19_01055 [Candidatus Woesearchaeota archaeon]|nr:hypothetical protein [Candidatus Woesearchaeota archaeon]